MDGRDDQPVRHPGVALAIPLIAALFLHVTPFEFGLLATVEFLPFILISLPAGVWVDRLRRKPIMIVGDLGRAAALLSIPIAAYFGALTIWQLYLVGFINGCLTVFFDVSYQAYLPRSSSATTSWKATRSSRSAGRRPR